MHEVSDFQVEILVNHKRSILCVRPSIKILFAVFLPIVVVVVVLLFYVHGKHPRSCRDGQLT